MLMNIFKYTSLTYLDFFVCPAPIRSQVFGWVHPLAVAGALLILTLLSCFCGWIVVMMEIWGCDLDLNGGESANLGLCLRRQ
jgi:hypothetical protein